MVERERIERSATRVRGFESPELDFQLLRQLGATPFGGASVGGALAAAARIKDETPATWVKVFTEQARQREEDGDARARRGHAVSARGQLLEASNAYRAAEYYSYVDDPAHRQLGLKSRECFGRAMRLAPAHVCEEAWIPFEDIALPGYFLAPDASRAKRKTMVLLSGYDGTLEELYFAGGRAGVDRGYNVLLVAGPGQMDTLRFHPERHFRPDWEKPIGAVLDWLLARPDVEPAHVALHGQSIGGYYSVRAASRDERIRALIPNSPLLDVRAYLVAMIGSDPASWPDVDQLTPDALARMPAAELPPVMREAARSMVARYGQPSFGATFEYLKQFRVDDPGRIRCPCLALVGAGEGSEAKRQCDAFAKGVRGEVTTFVFTAEQGADAHCQAGNLAFSSAVVYDWLDELFG